MIKEPFYINKNVEQKLSFTSRKASMNQAYSGIDIQCAVYLPLLTKASAVNSSNHKFKVFGDLQTLSISSTRSVSPVRVLGQASPLGYTRGAKTYAGTLVFATINHDAFIDLYDVSLSEATFRSSSSFIADLLPPFSIIITAANESGGAAAQAIHGVTLTNYGTTYSIGDVYTETTYTYVATDIVPLVADNNYIRNQLNDLYITSYKNISNFIQDSMSKSYSKLEQIYNRIRNKTQSNSNTQEL